MRLIVTCAFAASIAVTGLAQTRDRPSAANLAAREWFQDARFGLFVHILDAPERAVLLPPLGAKVGSARFLASGRSAEFSEHDFGVVVKLPTEVVDPIDTIVALDLDAKS